MAVNRNCTAAMSSQVASHLDKPTDAGRHTTSLTPFGMSFWALILAACGGGGGGGGGGPETAGPPTPATNQAPTTPKEQDAPQPAASQSVSRSGHVYDGPIIGARVYVDDGDGELTDKDHYVGTTNAQGVFEGSVPESFKGNRYIVDLDGSTDLGEDGQVGGSGINRDRAMSGTWLAPAEAKVVSPFTHLIATRVMFPAQIESQFPRFDPLVDNPFGPALTDDKRQVFEAVRKVLPKIARMVEDNRRDIDANTDNIKQNAKNIKQNAKNIQDLKNFFLTELKKLAQAQSQPESGPEAGPTADPPPPNARPTAADDTAKPVDEGTAVHGDVRANDRDAETPMDALVVTGVWVGDGTSGTPGRISEALQGAYGQLTLHADGRYSYVAGSNADRPVEDVFTYRIADTDGGVHTARLTVRVNGVPDTPQTKTNQPEQKNDAPPPEIDAPPPNTKPAGVTLNRPSHQVDEGENVTGIGALARITIIDDDLGTVGLEALPLDSIFRFVQINRNVYELHLKRSVTLDQSKVGTHKVTIQAIGDGAGDDPDPKTFTLTVRDVEHAPVLALRGTATINEGTLTADTDTGVTFSVSDADSGEAGYRAPTPTLSGDARFKIVGNSTIGYRIVAIDGARFTSGEAITLTLTATDGNNTDLAPDTKEISFTIGDIKHPPTLTITAPSGQTPISETIGDGVTERIDTGIRVLADDPDGDLDPLLIEVLRPNGDGGYIYRADNRFELVDGKLFVKAGQTFNYEHVNNPHGVIRFRVIARDSAQNEVTKSFTLQLTDADDPTIIDSLVIDGVVNGSAPLGKELRAEYSASDEDGIALRQITWTRNDVPVTDSNGVPVISDSITPGVNRAGEWRAILTVTDSLGNKKSFTSTAVTVTAPPPAATTRGVTHDIYENHPLTKPVIDLDGAGMFAMAPTSGAAGAPDNVFFRVDAVTGKIWFVPLDANGNGVKDPGDYPLLDAEDHRDQGGDGTYDLRLTRTAPDGTTQTIDLALTVRNLPVVNAAGEEVERTDATSRDSIGMIYGYLRASEELKTRIAGLIDDWFRDYRDDLTPQETAAQTQYLKYLMKGTAWWAPPDGGTLYMSWSLNTKWLNSQQTIDAARKKVEEALAEYEKFLAIDFIEVADSPESLGVLEFDIIEGRRAIAGASGREYGHLVSVGLENHLSTYIHEIGHVLGLAHPFNYHGGGIPYSGPRPQGHFARNPDELKTSNSIMTYGPLEKSTITKNDINALQFLYGIPGTDYHGLYADIEDWFDQPGHNDPILL